MSFAFILDANIDQRAQKLLKENAALKCISVDFIHVVDKRHEPSSAGLPDFAHSISEFENCFFHSLKPGLLFGIPHAILPSSYIDVDLEDSQNLNLSPELNQQVFSALCRSLTRQSSGLLCSSSINLDTRSVAFFPCFYVLLPGDGCSLLAKRVAASEELLPLPSVASVMDGVEASEIIASEMEAALGQRLTPAEEAALVLTSSGQQT
eukprot:jgi/Mesen1/3934/ME000209S02945